METKNNNHGGYRPGSGRKRNERNLTLCVRISQEAMDAITSHTTNKARFIDNLLKHLPEGIDDRGLMDGDR